jgi:hypothetical protein
MTVIWVFIAHHALWSVLVEVLSPSAAGFQAI